MATLSVGSSGGGETFGVENFERIVSTPWVSSDLRGDIGAEAEVAETVV